jgi:hypothetical protein
MSGAQERIVGQRPQHKQNQRLNTTAIVALVPRKCTFVEQRHLDIKAPARFVMGFQPIGDILATRVDFVAGRLRGEGARPISRARCAPDC